MTRQLEHRGIRKRRWIGDDHCPARFSAMTSATGSARGSDPAGTAAASSRARKMFGLGDGHGEGLPMGQ